MSNDTCHVAGCREQVGDAFVCRSCADQLTGDLRRIISGHRAGTTVRNVHDATGGDFYATGMPIEHRVVKGHRAGAPLEVDEIRPGDFARNLSTPFDHNGGLLADLVASYSRETRTGRGGRASETPLVWHEKAGELRMLLCATLVRYARVVAAARQVALPDDAEPLTVAVWLSRHVRWLRHHAAGAAAVREIHIAVNDIIRIIDPVADRTYVGPCTAVPLEPGDCTCDCHERCRGQQRKLCASPSCKAMHGEEICARDLYATESDVDVVCPDCHQRYDVAVRRAWLLEEAHEILGTATEISQALTRLEQPCTPEKIRKWKERGRLVVRGEDPRTHAPMFRVGDVRDLLDQAAAAAARRDAQKAG